MKTHVFLLFLFVTITPNLFALKGDIRSIAKRPGHSEIFVAGEFNVIFVLDSRTGKTLRTINLETGADCIEFAKDGSSLIATSLYKAQFINPATGEIKKTISGSSFYLFPESYYLVDVESYTKTATIYSTLDGGVGGKFTFDFEPTFVGLAKDEAFLYVFAEEEDMADEKSLISIETKPIEGVNIYNQAYIEQQADGKGVRFEVINMDRVEKVGAYKTAYSPKPSSFSYNVNSYKGNVFILGWEYLFKVDDKFAMTPIEYKEADFAYATASSNDGRYIIQSSTKEGNIYDCETKTFKKYNAKVGDEFFYTVDLCTAGDTIYQLAKDYSVTLLNMKGVVSKRFKINEATGVEFEIYYLNGFRQKVDRDKEAEILNAALNSIQMPEINLENFLEFGKNNVLLTSFKSYDEAKAFKTKLNDSKITFDTNIIPKIKK